MGCYIRMDTKEPISVVWLRRDLRLHDNHALEKAMLSGLPVLCLFIFDSQILDSLADKSDLRVNFIYKKLAELKNKLNIQGSDLLVKYGNVKQVWETVFSTYHVRRVFANRDYEPYAQTRDDMVADIAIRYDARLFLCKDHVIFEPHEVLKDDGTPYLVFSAFAKKWLSKFSKENTKPYVSTSGKFWQIMGLSFPDLSHIGFREMSFHFPPAVIHEPVLAGYSETRDFPAIENGTSKLGLHLRFGTISIRELASVADIHSGVFLKELVWREFFAHLLYHFPASVTFCFRKEYERIQWLNNEEHFQKWCAGETGYPLVDAGMRELNATGFMHNRVRMVVASFLTKHLLIDWRWGERYFAEKLLDFDLSANVGNWQWAAGCGCDAAPYFRVFNPSIQAKKFDPTGGYIKKWVSEINDFSYPKPVVEHEFARNRAISTYKKYLTEV